MHAKSEREMSVNFSELNNRLDPIAVLRLIGYEKSHPKQSGGELRDYCPIHQGDNQQSLAIGKNNHFICHSCGAKGDLITLFQLSRCIDRPLQAAEELSTLFQIHSLQNRQDVPKKPNNTAPKVPAITAKQVWDEAKESDGHPYLIRKGVKPCFGLRYSTDMKENPSIVVPFYDVEGNLKTIQYINNRKEKNKFYLKGHKSDAAFFSTGIFKDGDTIYLAEGLATALTIKEIIHEAVISFGSAWNMPKVILALKSKYPYLKMIICLDDNEAAMESAKNIGHIEGVSFRKPCFDGVDRREHDDDFNDLKRLTNEHLLREQLHTPFIFTTAISHQSFIERPQDDYAANLKRENMQNIQENFYDILGKTINDINSAKNLENRTYEIFEQEHKKRFSSTGLILGYDKIDEQLSFFQGDFVVVQGMSNHGKSSLMLQFASRFLTREENQDQDLVCLYITYESSPLMIEAKFLNLLGHEKEEGIVILCNRRVNNKYISIQT